MSGFEMSSDNDAIVNEILQDMNSNNMSGGFTQPMPGMMNEPASFTMDNSSAYANDQMAQFSHQVDPTMRNMMPPPQVAMQQNMGGGIKSTPIVKMDKKQGALRSFLQNFKYPLLVAFLVYLFFNPIVYGQFQRFIPNIYGSTDSMMVRHLRFVIMGIIIGTSYAVLSKFI